MNYDDNNYEVIDGKRTKIVRDGGRVRTRMTVMDSLDAVISRELRSQGIVTDGAAHRPGFRTAATLQHHAADAAHVASLVVARDAKEAAYMEYQRDLIGSWRSPEQKLADARARTAMEAFASGKEQKEGG